MQFNINTDAAVKFTNTLEKLAKSALPVAVRETLNNAAFDVKGVTMPESAQKEFVNRTKKFFKANSKVERANGFDLKTMQASVGFYENRLQNQSTNYAVKDLEEQEVGGTIESKTFIPLPFARVGGVNSGRVRPNLRLKKIREKIIDSKKVAGKTARQRFMVAAKTVGVGGFVINNKIVWQINSINLKRAVNATERTPLYSVKKGRSVRVNATHFMKTASLNTVKKMERFYEMQAQKQIEKYYNRK